MQSGESYSSVLEHDCDRTSSGSMTVLLVRGRYLHPGEVHWWHKPVNSNSAAESTDDFVPSTSSLVVVFAMSQDWIVGNRCLLICNENGS